MVQGVRSFWDRDYLGTAFAVKWPEVDCHNAYDPRSGGITGTIVEVKSNPANELWGHKKEYEIPEELGFPEPQNQDQFLLFE